MLTNPTEQASDGSIEDTQGDDVVDDRHATGRAGDAATVRAGDGNRTCGRGHAPVGLRLANTGGDRDGRVFECPDCGARVLVTAGLLVGGERMRLLSPQGQD